MGEDFVPTPYFVPWMKLCSHEFNRSEPLNLNWIVCIFNVKNKYKTYSYNLDCPINSEQTWYSNCKTTQLHWLHKIHFHIPTSCSLQMIRLCTWLPWDQKWDSLRIEFLHSTLTSTSMDSLGVFAFSPIFLFSIVFGVLARLFLEHLCSPPLLCDVLNLVLLSIALIYDWTPTQTLHKKWGSVCQCC